MGAVPALWIALDVPDTASALHLATQVRDSASVFKIGLELFTAEGPAVVHAIKKLGRGVFLDLKFNDIPNTVAAAVRSAVRLGVDFLDVHALGGSAMMRAALDAAGDEATRLSRPTRPRLLAITVLTSLDREALRRDLGVSRSPRNEVLHLAALARSCGMDGVVASLEECAPVRRAIGPEFLVACPGVRLPGVSSDDQRRVGSPRDAARRGASAIIVGRPVRNAPDPALAARQILASLHAVEAEAVGT